MHQIGVIKIMKFSILILTYNRVDAVRDNLNKLIDANLNCEIIVVDNSSDSTTEDLLQEFPQVSYIKGDNEIGVAARNYGMKQASGDIVITLDDDVFGITNQDIESLTQRFNNSSLGAVCFKVLDSKTRIVCNWCHHRKVETSSELKFATYEISEGAVAFNRKAFLKSGGYPETFFISHEGKDLAYRLMNNGFSVEYDGNISVIHSHNQSGRPSWRRYYYDSRNAIWLALRNMPFWYGFKFLFITLSSLAIYGARDGYLKYCFSGVRDALQQINDMKSQRNRWTKETTSIIVEIDKNAPSFYYMLKKRLFRNGVSI
jgi:GT2 family glycosyltransferase